MDRKDLKRLNRKQLLELLLAQTQRIDELEKQLEITRKALKRRMITEMEAGSIAEAAIRINKVFEAAQAAAYQYLYNVKQLADSNESDDTQKHEE